MIKTENLTINNVKYYLHNVYQKLMAKPFSALSIGPFSFFEVGFHGDKYLLDVVDSILQKCDYFIETGTSVGSTIAYVAKTYPHIHCLSCEPDQETFKHAERNTAAYKNVNIYNETSQAFIERLKSTPEVFDARVFFSLDAHGYGFEWPLKDEVSFVSTYFEGAFILIDDFKVPGLDCFGYDAYNKGQICSFDYIKDALNTKLNYRLYYPQYTERTSKHHPLRGWGLIEFGYPERLSFPDNLANKVQLALEGQI